MYEKSMLTFFVLLILFAIAAAFYFYVKKPSGLTPVTETSSASPTASLSVSADQDSASEPAPTKPESAQAKTVTTADGLTITDEVLGAGEIAVSGKSVTVQYVGTLTNGKKFDSSYDHGQAFTFSLGAGQVIRGWDEGVAGMKVGGKRKLVIPPSLGYGAQAIGSIPSNSTLIFEVELVSVK